MSHSQDPPTLRALLHETVEQAPFYAEKGTALYTLPGNSDALLRMHGMFLPRSAAPFFKGETWQATLQTARYLRPVTSAAETLPYGKTLYRLCIAQDFHPRRDGGRYLHDWPVSLVARMPPDSLRMALERHVQHRAAHVAAGMRHYHADYREAAIQVFESLATAPPTLYRDLLTQIGAILAAGHEFELVGENLHCDWPVGSPVEAMRLHAIDAGRDLPPRAPRTFRTEQGLLPEALAQRFQFALPIPPLNTLGPLDRQRLADAGAQLTATLLEAARETAYPTGLEELKRLQGSAWSRRPGLAPGERPSWRPIHLDAADSVARMHGDVRRRLAGASPAI